MKLVCLAAVLICFASCGIEDYPYIYSIPTGNVANELNSRVRVYIPNSNNGNAFFTHYTIFYRIYISDYGTLTLTESEFSRINPTLYSDHQRVRPYIGNDSMSSSSIASLFRSINYNQLALEGTEIDYLLSGGDSIFGKYFVIDFSRESENQTIPYLFREDQPNNRYPLLRYDGGGSYEVRPADRYFINAAELRDTVNINDSYINGDVTDKPNVARDYTYVSMYIAATGIDEEYVQLFSSPTHIGVFRLADTN